LPNNKPVALPLAVRLGQQVAPVQRAVQPLVQPLVGLRSVPSRLWLLPLLLLPLRRMTTNPRPVLHPPAAPEPANRDSVNGPVYRGHFICIDRSVKQ
jgi:hypothetical protein